MPRIRTIKPEYWADEKLGPLSPLTRLVYVGLWSLADDAGRLIDSVKQLDGALFPYTDDTCRGSLDELSANGRLQRGETASGQRVIQIVHWHHQKIDKPNLLAALPPIVEQSSTPRRNVDDASAPLSVSVPTTNYQRPTKPIDGSADSLGELRGRLPEDCQTALSSLTAASPNPPAWVAEIGAMLDGMHGPKVAAKVMGLALRDMLVAGSSPNARSLRGFVRKAAIVEPTTPNGQPLTKAERFAAAVAAHDAKESARLAAQTGGMQ